MNKKPLAYYLDDFVTKEECAHLQLVAEPQMSRARVSDTKAGQGSKVPGGVTMPVHAFHALTANPRPNGIPAQTKVSPSFRRQCCCFVLMASCPSVTVCAACHQVSGVRTNSVAWLTGLGSHWRDYHFADALSSSLLKNLPKVEGGAAE